MNHRPDFHPHVYPTGDGERSTAGSNYGDWRPATPPRPHGYVFEARFAHGQGLAPHPDDADYRRLRDEHARELAAHYPHWRQQRYQRFADDFGRWREQHSASAAAQATDAAPGAAQPPKR